MLLQDEQYVIKWLSQYGALRHEQVLRLLNKPVSTAEKIIRNLKRWLYVTDIEGGYLGIDPTVRPDPKTIAAVWVLLKYGTEVAPMEHFPATYPSQLFFLKQQTGYEIIVIGRSSAQASSADGRHQIHHRAAGYRYGAGLAASSCAMSVCGAEGRAGRQRAAHYIL